MTRTSEHSAYDTLRTAILALDLVPGEKLSERGLESLLGTSRTPIRSALGRLEGEGLTQRVKRGWRVSPIDVSEIRAVMEYREAIEVAVVELALQRASDEELSDLGLIATAHHDLDNEEAGLRDGGDFHVALARLSGNHFMSEALSASLTRLSRTRWLEVRTSQSRALARAEHLEIIAALLTRDCELATSLVVAHSRGTRERLLNLLSDERQRLRGRGFAIIESSATVSIGDAR